MGDDRAEVTEQVELSADPQQAQLRPLISRVCVPLRASDSAQQGRIRTFAGIDCRHGQRVSGGVDGGSADQLFIQLDRKSV